MKYLLNIKSLEELKTTYKKLAVKLHSDMGGNTEDMQTLNNEFEMLFPYFKNLDTNKKTTESDSVKETASGYMRTFYTQNGWTGSRYNGTLSTKDISKKIREFVKCVYPSCKFSVTSSRNEIIVSLMEAPFEAIVNEENYIQVNRYNIYSDDRLVEKTKKIMKTVCDYIQTYNYDDSDIMTDYFDCKFYIHLSIGRWNKPFKVVNRTERIIDKSPYEE